MRMTCALYDSIRKESRFSTVRCERCFFVRPAHSFMESETLANGRSFATSRTARAEQSKRRHGICRYGSGHLNVHDFFKRRFQGAVARSGTHLREPAPDFLQYTIFPHRFPEQQQIQPKEHFAPLEPIRNDCDICAIGLSSPVVGIYRPASRKDHRPNRYRSAGEMTPALPPDPLYPSGSASNDAIPGFSPPLYDTNL